jgi:hypothetical protein
VDHTPNSKSFLSKVEYNGKEATSGYGWDRIGPIAQNANLIIGYIGEGNDYFTYTQSIRGIVIKDEPCD